MGWMHVEPATLDYPPSWTPSSLVICISATHSGTLAGLTLRAKEFTSPSSEVMATPPPLDAIPAAYLPFLHPHTLNLYTPTLPSRCCGRQSSSS